MNRQWTLTRKEVIFFLTFLTFFALFILVLYHGVRNQGDASFLEASTLSTQPTHSPSLCTIKGQFRANLDSDTTIKPGTVTLDVSANSSTDYSGSGSLSETGKHFTIRKITVINCSLQTVNKDGSDPRTVAHIEATGSYVSGATTQNDTPLILNLIHNPNGSITIDSFAVIPSQDSSVSDWYGSAITAQSGTLNITSR